MRRKLCLAGVERLESRRLLSASPAAVGELSGNGSPTSPPGEFIAPPLGLPPIELPPGIAPPAGTTLSPTEALPPVLSENAENISISALVAFGVAHPGATTNTSSHITGNSVTVTETMTAPAGSGTHDSTPAITYRVKETLLADGGVDIDVDMTRIDDGTLELLAANQFVMPNGNTTGTMFDFQIGGGTQESVAISVDIDGHEVTLPLGTELGFVSPDAVTDNAGSQ